MGYHKWKIYFGPSADSNSQCLDQKTPVLINCAIQAQKNSGGILRSFHCESLNASSALLEDRGYLKDFIRVKTACTSKLGGVLLISQEGKSSQKKKTIPH